MDDLQNSRKTPAGAPITRTLLRNARARARQRKASPPSLLLIHPSLEISSPWKVTLKGADITDLVRSIDVQHRLGDLTEVHLTLLTTVAYAQELPSKARRVNPPRKRR